LNKILKTNKKDKQTWPIGKGEVTSSAKL